MDEQEIVTSSSAANAIMERAVSDESFRTLMIRDFEGATKEYNLTSEDIAALEGVYASMAEAGEIEVLDTRENPTVSGDASVDPTAVDASLCCTSSSGCCCCCPCCCCA